MNEIGSYRCVGTCPSGLEGTGRLEDGGGCHVPTDCPTGYQGSLNTSCVDIDECTSNFNPCTPASSCINTVGGYNCSTCQPGYSGSPCMDINECRTMTNACDSLTNCTNILGSWECSACPTGYTGTGKTGCVLNGSTTGVLPSTSTLPSPSAGPRGDDDLSSASSNYNIWVMTFIAASVIVIMFI